MMKRLQLIAFCSLSSIFSLSALDLDEALALIDNGDYTGAFEALATLKEKSPKDARISFYYGMTALKLDKKAEAEQALAAAADKGYVDAFAPLTEMALEAYNISDAEDLISDWRAALKKARKSEPAELSAAESRRIRMANQLGRVEAVPVIKSYTVPRSTFENALAGLNDTDLAKGHSFAGNESVPFFINNTGREVFWTAKDADGVSRLYTAGVLDDGTREEARELTEFIGDGDILAPFIMEDGETLYFAARRDDSLGGYDIYMTRRDNEGGFYEPSNIGMPYNSPSDELLFVIDEQNDLGWWASARTDNPETVTIYVFVPNKTRINIDSDNENIADRARLTDLSATWPEGFDTKAATARIPTPAKTRMAKQDKSPSSDFELSLGNGRIVRSMKEFRNPDAATAMSDVLRLRNTLNDTVARLKSMRLEYADGNTALKGDIRVLEAEVEKQQKDLRDATNRVIRLEAAR